MFEWIFDRIGIFGNIMVLLLGMLVLDRSSDIAVDNSVKVAEITGLGKMTIGFLLVALFTTLPELSVSIFSITDPDTIGVAIGNVLGSNIVNVCLILGLCFLISVLKKKDGTCRLSRRITENVRDLFFGLFIASLIPLALIYIGYASNIIGVILVSIFIANNVQMIRSKKNVRMDKQYDNLNGEDNMTKHILLTLLGVAGVVVSAYFIVETASRIAEYLGVPKVVIGATVVAFGTSLPELATGINASMKGHLELVLGNIVGSGFANITLILGVALLGAPFRVNMAAYSHLAMFSVITNLLLWYFLSGERISWRESMILLFMYMLFITTIFSMR
ncbi:MAG: sodium:calcium antiporter [Candidatus Bathyarchaeia archaeon]